MSSTANRAAGCPMPTAFCLLPTAYSHRLKAHAIGATLLVADDFAVGADDGLSVDAPEGAAAPAGDRMVGLDVDVHLLRAQEAAEVLDDGKIGGFGHG